MTGKGWIYPGYFLPASKIAGFVAGRGKYRGIGIAAGAHIIDTVSNRKITGTVNAISDDCQIIVLITG